MANVSHFLNLSQKHAPKEHTSYLIIGLATFPAPHPYRLSGSPILLYASISKSYKDKDEMRDEMALYRPLEEHWDKAASQILIAKGDRRNKTQVKSTKQ